MIVDLAATGVRDDVADDVLQFAVAANRRYATPLYPTEYDIYLDTNRDGTDDFVVYAAEQTGFAATGVSVVNVVRLSTGTGGAGYYNQADFDSSTQVLTVPLSAVGLTAGSTFDFSVCAYDNYFSGALTDAIEGQSWTVGSAKYSTASAAVAVPAGKKVSVPVTTTSSVGSSQTGLLLLYGAARTKDFQAVTLTGS